MRPRAATRRIAVAVVLVAAAVAAALLRVGSESPAPAAVAAVPALGDDANGATPAEPGRVVAPVPNEAPPPGASTERSAAPRTNAAPVIPNVVLFVHDPDGHPVAGARVETFADTVPGVRHADERGLADLGFGIDRFASVHVRVDAEGHGHASVGRAARPRIEVELPWIGVLTGRVLDADTGAPIAGAEVRVFHHRCGQHEPDVAVALPDGRYALERVPLERQVAIVAAAGGYRRNLIRRELAPSATPIEIDFVLARGRAVRGHVEDFLTGERVPGARIQIPGSEAVSTDVDGTFELLLPRGETRLDLTVERDGYCDVRIARSVPPPESNAPVRVRLVPSARVAGVVRADDGTPVEGAWIHVDWPHGRRLVPGSPLDDSPKHRVEGIDEGATSDAFGRFALDVGPWRERPELQARASGHRPSSITLDGHLVAGESRRVSVVLDRALGGTVAGRVTFDGRPAEGSVLWSSGERSGSGGIWDTGYYRLEDVGPGSVRLVVADARESKTLAEAKVAVSIGETVRQDLALSSWVVGGVVRHDNGKPARVVVEAHRDDWLFPNVTWTGESGSFQFELFGAAAPVEIRLDHGGARYSVANVEPGTLDVELVVPEVTSVRLRAVDAVDGTPIPQVAFEIASALPVDTWFSGRDPGEDPAEGWRTAWLQPGTYDAVAATVDESRYAALPFVLRVPPAEGPVDREVALDRGVLVSLRFDPADPPEPTLLIAEALADGAVPTEHPGGYWTLEGEGVVHRWTYYDTHQGTTLHGVAPGRYRVLSPSGTLRFAPAVIEVPPGVDELEVALAWERIDSE